mgnify:CR=1 FL=1
MIKLDSPNYTGQNVRIKALHVAGQPEINFLARQVIFKNIITPAWQSEAAYGKMDNIPYYTNTTRQVQIDFQSVVTKEVNYGAVMLMDNIATLMKFQYPRYSYAKQTNARVLSSPPFLEIDHYMVDADDTYGQYDKITGYLNGSLVIQAGSEEGVGGQKVPLLYNVDELGKSNKVFEAAYRISMNITVLHERPPGWVAGDWVADTVLFPDLKYVKEDRRETASRDSDVKEPDP